MVYASSGNMKCFQCGDVGHKRFACAQQRAESGGVPPADTDPGEGPSGQGVVKHIRWGGGALPLHQVSPAVEVETPGSVTPEQQSGEAQADPGEDSAVLNTLLTPGNFGGMTWLQL